MEDKMSHEEVFCPLINGGCQGKKCIAYGISSNRKWEVTNNITNVIEIYPWNPLDISNYKNWKGEMSQCQKEIYEKLKNMLTVVEKTYGHCNHFKREIKQ